MTNDSGQAQSLLEGLFSSRVRVKLLALFMGQPGTHYHGRELAKQTGEHFNAVWQELKHLEALGLLKAEKVGNQVHYAPDPTFPFLAELRVLMLKAEGRGVPAQAAKKTADTARPQPPSRRPFVIGEVD